jgi:superfamily II DNA or RNA helicase
MTFQLYGYQREAIDDLFSRWAAGAVRVPTVAATGLGKSEIIAASVERWLLQNPGKRVIVMAHMNELITQLSAKIRERNPHRRVGIVKGTLNQTTAEIIVASRQTLSHESRRKQLKRVGLIVIDECHHAVESNSYGTILRHFGAFDEPAGVQVAGFTATLIRGDRAKLSTVWEECTFQRDILFGIKNGFLTDVKGERIVVEGFDKRNIAKSAGDYSESAAAEELERTFAVETIAKEYLRLAHDRQGLAFWPLVATAKHASEVFNDFGIPSAYVHGQMADDDVHKVRLALRSGEIQVVHNAMKWTEGFDEPCVEAVVIGRPTRSPVTYVQIVGRGLRRRRGEGWPEGGYQRPCLLLDAVGAGEECSLTPGVDLSPERRTEIDEQYPDATLSELEELYAEAVEQEVELQRAGASFMFESDEYSGATETKTFDPLQRERIWGRTSAGNYFIRASRYGKGDAFIFIVPSLSGPEGTYDIAGCSVNTGYIPERDVRPEWVAGFPQHTGMELERALLHGEELAGTSYNQRKSSWRNRAPGRAIKFEAYHLGIKPGGKTHGELQDEVFAALADRRIDPLVDSVRASVQ